MARVSKALDNTFKISVSLKGLDGLLETIGGLLLLFVRPETLNSWAHSLTQHELSTDPHDFFAIHIMHSVGNLSHGATLFAAIYLLSHGISKIVLVIAVLKQKLWAYPGIIILLGLFIIYQLYRIVFVRFSISLTLLTAFDALIVWLTWREWLAHDKKLRQEIKEPS